MPYTPPRYPDPHRPLWLDDDERWPNPEMAPLVQEGYRVWLTREGWMAKRGRKLLLPWSVIDRLRRRLFDDQGGCCIFCQQPMRVEKNPVDKGEAVPLATIEHLQAVANGGTWKRRNLACSCEFCNKAKQDLKVREYRAILAECPPEPSGRWRAKVRGRATRLHVENQARRRERRAGKGSTCLHEPSSSSGT